MQQIQKLSLFNVLKIPCYQCIGIFVSTLFFAIQYYFLAKLPGQKNYQCITGGFLTGKNIMVILLTSILIALCIIGFTVLFQEKKKKHMLEKATGGILATLGTLFSITTSFCTICTLPILSLFGISISLQSLSIHQWAFQIISIVCLLASLYLIDRQIRKNCSWCVK